MKVNGHSKEQENQQVKQRRSAKESSQTTSTAALTTSTSANQVSEEDVFARLVNDEISRTLGSEGVEKFKALVDKQIKDRTRDDGTVNLEKVMKGALKWASNEKHAVLSRADAQKIYSNTFQAAQLDNNTDILDDTSVQGATLDSDTAFSKARVSLEQIVSGKTTLPERDIMERSTASKTSRFSEYFIKNYINELSDSKEVKDVKIESGDFQI
jgi:hypothetical protein